MPSLVVPPMCRDGLVLRPYEARDLDALASVVTRDEVMARVGGPLRRDEVAGLLDRYRTPDDPRILCALAVLTKRSPHEHETYVGSALLTWCRDVDEAAPELGFLVHPDHQGRGHATTIARALLEIARAQGGATQVYATVDVDHAASIRVLEKAGLTRVRSCREDESRALYRIGDEAMGRDVPCRAKRP